jgi:hypothetical protein
MLNDVANRDPCRRRPGRRKGYLRCGPNKPADADKWVRPMAVEPGSEVPGNREPPGGSRRRRESHPNPTPMRGRPIHRGAGETWTRQYQPASSTTAAIVAARLSTR